MMYVVCALFLVIVAVSMTTNPDLLSPAKLYLVTFLAFHIGGVLSYQGSTELWLLLLLVLLVGLVIVTFEATVARPYKPGLATMDAARIANTGDMGDGLFFAGIWLFSVPALFAQGFMIQHFGGIEGYINSLGFRVIEWRGLGWAKTLISTLLPVHLAYFAAGLTKPRSRTWWAVYGVHFICLLLMGLLSGSRSGVLNIFAMQLFCYHYLKRRISIRNAVTFAASLMFAALVLGVVRNDLKVQDGSLTTGLDSTDTSARLATLYYGIDPLELLLGADLPQLAYGSTFLSLLTNAIPRDWWPDKPDPGGVYFTKLYTGDAWDGASNLTPTFLGEWVMNFGWAAGLLLFAFSYPALFYWVTQRYRKIAEQLHARMSHRSALDFLLYLIIMWSTVALMTGEVTNVVLTAFLSQIVPLLLLRATLTTRGHS